MLSDLNICDRLSFWDGIKNAVVVFGHCAGDIFIKSFHEYFAGFHNGFLAGVVWAVVGIFWTLIKHAFLAIPRYILCLVTVFFRRLPSFITLDMRLAHGRCSGCSARTATRERKKKTSAVRSKETRKEKN